MSTDAGHLYSTIEILHGIIEKLDYRVNRYGEALETIASETGSDYRTPEDIAKEALECDS